MADMEVFDRRMSTTHHQTCPTRRRTGRRMMWMTWQPACRSSSSASRCFSRRLRMRRRGSHACWLLWRTFIITPLHVVMYILGVHFLES